MNRGDSSIKSISSILTGVAARVIIIALLTLFSYAAVSGAFRFGYSIFCADAAEEPPGRDVEVTVEKGETIDELADRLYEDGIIHSKYAFRIQARLYHIGFYPGTYSINTSMSTREILKTIDMTEQEYADKKALEAASSNEDKVIGGGDEGGDGAEDNKRGTGGDGNAGGGQ